MLSPTALDPAKWITASGLRTGTGVGEHGQCLCRARVVPPQHAFLKPAVLNPEEKTHWYAASAGCGKGSRNSSEEEQQRPGSLLLGKDGLEHVLVAHIALHVRRFRVHRQDNVSAQHALKAGPLRMPERGGR